jgi:hypothetical protein
MAYVLFCASLLGIHICRESCLPQSSGQFKYPHPQETVSIKFPRVGNKNQSNAPHMPNLPPPLRLTLIGALQNH